MDVTTDGRTYRIDVRRDGDEWQVTIDGRTFRVDAISVGPRWSLLVHEGTTQLDQAPPRSYDVAFERRTARELLVHVGDVVVPISLEAPRTRAARRGGSSATGAVQNIVAPMPGRVVKVLVGPGEVLVDRQPVIVLEAMKMQNEVRAARGGRVSEVCAVEGSLVDAGSVLVVMASEPPAGEA